MFGFTSQSQRRNDTRPTPVPRLELLGLESRDNPVPIATPDFYTVAAGSVLTVSARDGLLANDFSTDNPNAILTASRKTAVVSNPPNGGNVPALPANTLTLQPNGSFTFIAPSGYDASRLGPVTFQYATIDETTNTISVFGTVTITISNNQTSKLFATGAGPGAGPQVRVYDATSGTERFSFFAYEQSFTGGVRVATGDLNQDGVDDLVTSPAEGGSGRIQEFDGTTAVQILNFLAFNDPNFRGGAEIAIGDVDGPDAVGNRTNELIIGAGLGGGPRVTVLTITVPNPAVNNTVPDQLIATTFSDFFAYEPTFRNGVRVAAGNIAGLSANNSDRRDFIVTGAGPGGGPAVKEFDGRRTIGISTPPAERAFFAFDSGTRGGVSVAVGQFRGDGRADIVAGSGATDTFRIFDGQSTSQLRELVLPASDGSITPGIGGSGGTNSAGSTNFGGSGGFVTSLGGISGTGGIRVAVADRNADGLSDVIVGSSSGTLPRVRIFNGNSLSEISNFLAYPSTFLGGVFVGGNSL